MKRSSRVVLLFMGTATAGGMSMGLVLADKACGPARPGLARPGDFGESGAPCMTRGGFGGSSHRFTQHFHSGGG